MDVDAGLAFFNFVSERHRIWERRQAGAPQPWTDDPILASHKFTNVFRVLDPGSQFIFELAGYDDDPVDVLARLVLYRHTNLPDAWRAYAAETGGYPTLRELDDVLVFWKDYRARGGQLFSGAYMVYPQSSTPGTDKIESVVELTKNLAKNGTYREFLRPTAGQVDRFAELRQNKGVADFMSMQILTDWGYTPQCGWDYEDVFVVAGPGSKRGALLVDSSMKPEETIEWACNVFRSMDFPPRLLLGGDSAIAVYRLPSLMDVQNCFCEFSKYVKRKAGKPYKPAHPGTQSTPKLPDHWRNV